MGVQTHKLTLTQVEEIRERISHRVDATGRMVCPRCLQTDYKIVDNCKVVCSCNWVGDYREMMLVKTRSKKGKKH